MARHPAAFINYLSECRDRKLTIDSLQKTWDDLCDARSALKTLLDCGEAIVGANPQDANTAEAFEMYSDARENAQAVLNPKKPL